MNRIALKMLMGDRAKYFGIVIGITFASFLITQQLAIFVGLMGRTIGFLSDTGQGDVWVMDSKVQFIDDIKPLQDTELYRVRGITGVQWALPIYKGLSKARLDNGNFQTCNIVGLDDATLMGGPPEMLEGKLEDLRKADGIIVDENGAIGKLAKGPKEPGGQPVPLKVGDTIELNDHRAIVVGICRVSRTFQSQPFIYTTYSRATTFAPKERKLLSFILVKAKDGQPIEELCARIRSETGLEAKTTQSFKETTISYFMKYTGIPINFGIAVVLGFLVGTAIAGQTFYNFTLDNLKYFGALKAMGASNFTLLRMILLQSLTVGAIGYGLGVGMAAFVGFAARNTELAFLLPWQLLVITAAAVLLICALTSMLSLYKVFRLEPAIVFKS
jgi:putative ABC transport system permease protein